MNPLDALAIVLLILPGVCWLQLLILNIVENGEGTSPALRDAFQGALLRAVGSTMVALLALARLADVSVPGGLALMALVGALIIMALPSAIWLVKFYRGGFTE